MRTLPYSTIIASAALAAVLVAASAATTHAQTVTVTGIEMGGGGFTVTVPTVEATDSNFDEAAIRALFADDLAVLADLATLDAARIHIPEIIFTYEVPAVAAGAEAESTTIVYRDLELLGVARGVASSAAIGGAEIPSATDDTVISLGRMSTGMLDIGGILGLYGIGDGGSSEIRPVYQDFVFEGGEVRGSRMTCDIGGAAVEEFRARAIKGSFADLLAAAHEFEAAEAAGTTPPPEAVASFIAYYTDFLTAFESTPATFAGFDCSGTNDSGTPMRVASGSLDMDGFRPGGYPSIALNDFVIEIGDMGHLAFANATLKEMDFASSIAALEAAGSEIDEEWFAANWRRMIPEMDGFSLTGFDMDFADEENPGQRVQVAVGAFDISLSNYVNGIPADISTSASNIQVALPEGGEAALLAALGIDDLDLGYDFRARWNAAEETIRIDTFRVTGRELGSINFSGMLANATPELFSDDPDTATLAATALTVTELRIDLDDAGLLPILIALGAADQNQAPTAFHAALAGMGTGLPIALLGPSPASMKLGTDVAAFLTGTPQLSLTITAKEPGGIGLADFMEAEEDPSALAGKISVSSETAGEPRTLVFPEIGPLPDDASDAAEADDAGETDKQSSKN